MSGDEQGRTGEARMVRGKTEAETCALNGWHVGTIIEGDEGYGPTRIRITAIGERIILARCVSCPGKVCRESSWTLTCREWAEVSS